MRQLEQWYSPTLKELATWCTRSKPREWYDGEGEGGRGKGARGKGRKGAIMNCSLYWLTILVTQLIDH